MRRFERPVVEDYILKVLQCNLGLTPQEITNRSHFFKLNTITNCLKKMVEQGKLRREHADFGNGYKYFIK